MRSVLGIVQILVAIVGCGHGKNNEEAFEHAGSERASSSVTPPDASGESSNASDQAGKSSNSGEPIGHGDPDKFFGTEKGKPAPGLEDLHAALLKSERLAGSRVEDFYDRLYSKASFKAFYGGLRNAVRDAKASKTTDESAQVETKNFMTGTGILAAVSWDEDEQILHVSISQLVRPTTHAVCSHYGRFMQSMLRDNIKGFAQTPFYTRSRVHHFHFQFRSQPASKSRDFETAYAGYRESHEPIVFKFLELDAKR